MLRYIGIWGWGAGEGDVSTLKELNRGKGTKNIIASEKVLFISGFFFFFFGYVAQDSSIHTPADSFSLNVLRKNPVAITWGNMGGRDCPIQQGSFSKAQVVQGVSWE